MTSSGDPTVEKLGVWDSHTARSTKPSESLGVMELASLMGMRLDPTTVLTPSSSSSSSLPPPSRVAFRPPSVFGVHLSESLSGGLAVPRVLVFLCEHLSQTSTPLRSLFTAAPDLVRVHEVKMRFNEGHLFDCGDQTITAYLLREYLRELPSSIIPTPL
jgi:hypothetical protein